MMESWATCYGLTHKRRTDVQTTQGGYQSCGVQILQRGSWRPTTWTSSLGVTSVLWRGKSWFIFFNLLFSFHLKVHRLSRPLCDHGVQRPKLLRRANEPGSCGGAEWGWLAPARVQTVWGSSTPWGWWLLDRTAVTVILSWWFIMLMKYSRVHNWLTHYICIRHNPSTIPKKLPMPPALPSSPIISSSGLVSRHFSPRLPAIYRIDKISFWTS